MERAGEILKKLLDSKGKIYSSVFRSWNNIAGISVGEHSRVSDILNKNLIVEVDHPGWMQIILLKKGALLSRIRRLYPELEITDLKLKLNSNLLKDIQKNEHMKPNTRKKQKSTIENEKENEIERVLNPVKQEDLKDRLRQLFLKSLDKRKHNNDS